MNKFIMFFLVIIFFGCSKSLDIQLEPEVSVYLSKESKKSFRITQKDEAYTKLDQWLDRNKANWYATSGRYPGGVYVKVKDKCKKLLPTCRRVLNKLNNIKIIRFLIALI